MHKLLARQVAQSKTATGDIDVEALLSSVDETYRQSESLRKSTDRSISLIIAELDRLNRDLDQQVQERTRAIAQREDELKAQNLRFDTALSNMPHGLCMLDCNGIVIVSNRRMGEIYGLQPDQLKPGTHVLDIVDAAIAAGTCTHETRNAVARLVSDPNDLSASHHVSELPDGRTLEIVFQPMADGGRVSIHQDVTAQKQAERQVTYLARHDGLTGIANRSAIMERIEEALDTLRVQGRAFAVLMLDLDQFKTINDSLGHPVGDAVLRLVSQRITSCLRSTDIVGRLGGDEFAILLSLDADAHTIAAQVADRLLQAVSLPCEVDGHQILVGTSIGIALAPDHGTQVDALMKNADMALYRAKAAGRRTYCFFEEAMAVQASAQRALQADLQKALRDEADTQIEIHYQPIVCSASGLIACCEALVRWRHPTRDLLPPDDFVPLAEETGLIGPLGRRILLKACGEAATWPDPIKLSVNISPVQIRQPGLVETLSQILAQTGLAPQRLEIEVTESVLLNGSAATVNTLNALKALGISIVLDDFGTGYSSLSYLRMFPFDKIKIDETFVHELALRPDSKAIVLAVAQLGKALGMKTIAEGVETQDQLDLVRAAGCTHVQGYLFGRPSPAADLNLATPVPRAA